MQRELLMPVVYDAIKAFKRRTTKPSASDALQNEVLLRDFGVDVMTALTRRVAGPASTLKRSANAAELATPDRAPLRLRSEPPAASSARAGTEANSVPLGGSKKKEQQIKVAALKTELRAFVVGKSATEIQAFLDKQFSKDDQRSLWSQVMREVCRNCLLAGKGVTEHSLRKCMEMGNECVLACSRCAAAGGSRAGQKHWTVNCPH